MKVTLEFELPEFKVEFDDCINGTKYRYMFEQVWENVFRPYHKHGYVDQELNTLLETETGAKVIEKLEEIYRNISKEE